MACLEEVKTNYKKLTYIRLKALRLIAHNYAMMGERKMAVIFAKKGLAEQGTSFLPGEELIDELQEIRKINSQKKLSRYCRKHEVGERKTLKVNRRIKRLSENLEKERSCNFCETISKKLQCCDRCKSVWYCSRKCNINFCWKVNDCVFEVRKVIGRRTKRLAKQSQSNRNSWN